MFGVSSSGLLTEEDEDGETVAGRMAGKATAQLNRFKMGKRATVLIEPTDGGAGGFAGQFFAGASRSQIEKKKEVKKKKDAAKIPKQAETIPKFHVGGMDGGFFDSDPRKFSRIS